VREGFDFTLELAGRIRQNDGQKHERPGGVKFPIGTTVEAMERELILQTLARDETIQNARGGMLGSA